jgi:hypothetical protein
LTNKTAQSPILFQFNNGFIRQQEISEEAVVQRFLDDEDRLPAKDRELDDLLKSLGCDDPYLFSQADYDHLKNLHDALVQREDNFNEEAVAGALKTERAGMRQAFAAVEQYAENHYLEDGSYAWDIAAEQGAIHMENNAGANENAAAIAVWPGRGAGAHPDAFERKIAAVVQERAQARERAIDTAYQGYIDNSRLLAGTVQNIRQALRADATLDEVNTRLTTVYQRQCEPTRENWLSHLGIAGNAIDGNAGLHFTTFNDSVPNPLAVRVDLRTRNELMDDIFGAVATARQLHATKVYNGFSYHKYYDATYIPAGGPPNIEAKAALDGEYNRMIQVMRGRVQAAKDAHGRIHHNNYAQQLGIGA